MSRENLLIRLGLDVEKFSSEERKAQIRAEALTTLAKKALNSGVALAVETVWPEGAAVEPAVNALLTKLCTVLNNPVIADDADMVAAALGRYGALLTKAIDNDPHKTLGDYVVIFESLFNA